MSMNINQVYVANPITSNASTDLMYFGKSPYGVTNDAAMTYANFSAQFGAPYTAAALTKTDDTNVTLTLGGTPSTALLHSASITAGWTGILSGTRGGTGVNNGSSTITIGGNVTFAGGFTFAGTITGNTAVTFPTSGTLATTAQIPTGAALTKTDDTNVTLTLGGSPTTSLINAASITAGWTGNLSVARGGTGAGSFTAHGVLVGEGTSAFTPVVLGAGQILIGTTASDPVAAAINSGTGILVANGSGSITVSLSGTAPGTLTWNDVAGTTQAASINNGYIISNASQTTVTLPATAAEGSVFGVQGKGAAGWILQMNTGQTCHFGSSATTSAGSITSTNLWDSVQIVCVTANTTFAVISAIGVLTVA